MLYNMFILCYIILYVHKFIHIITNIKHISSLRTLVQGIIYAGVVNISNSQRYNSDKIGIWQYNAIIIIIVITI